MASRPTDRLIALYGPTASGKTAVANELLARIDGEVVSADSAALYRDLPIISAAPNHPARLVGVYSVDQNVSVAEYQRAAHAAIDELIETGRTPILVGGTGLYFRAALSSFDFPPAPEPGVRERIATQYDEIGPETAHKLLAEADPAAAARVHPNDRRRVVRGLELAEAGHSLAPSGENGGENRLWTDDVRHPTLIVALDVADIDLEARIRARCAAMVEAGTVEEAKQAWSQPLSDTARKVLGLEEFATLEPDEAVEAVVTATLRLARYQQKWARRIPEAVMVSAAAAPQAIADDIVSLASTGQHLSRR